VRASYSRELAAWRRHDEQRRSGIALRTDGNGYAVRTVLCSAAGGESKWKSRFLADVSNRLR